MTFSGNPAPGNWDNYNLIKETFTLAVDAQPEKLRASTFRGSLH